MAKKWYESLFTDYAAAYDRESFTRGTDGECDFIEARDDHGRPIGIDCDERWYIPSELTWLLRQAGFASVGIFGAKLGAFSRANVLTPDDFEMLAAAVKP